MAAEEICTAGPLDPPMSSSGSQEMLSQDTQWCPTPHIVKIPCKMMLDLMLEELTLPKAKYDFHAGSRGRVTAVVTFYSSARMPDKLLRAIKLGGAEATDYEVAEESAAKEAITFMEAWENMEVEDLHYSELKYLEADREDLVRKLNVVQKEKKSMQKALSLAALQMIPFSNQLYSITGNSRPLGQGNAIEDIDATIQLFEGVAANLRLAGKRLKKDVRTNGAFP